MHRLRGAACGAALLLGFSVQANAVSVPRPFEPLTVRRVAGAIELGLWGRSYVFEAGPLPSEIRSQGRSLLAEPTRFTVNGGVPVVWQPPALVQSGGDAVRLRSTGSAGLLRFTAETLVEYDGMIAVKLDVMATEATRLLRLEYEVPLEPGVPRYFAHHLAYDYQVGNVDKRRMLEAAGTLPAGGLGLGFVPTLALGNRQVGVEWWSETNAHWSVASGARPFRVVRQPGAVRLQVRPISKPLSFAPGAIWRDSFELFVFPTRPPPERWRSVRILPYTRVAQFDQSVGTRFVALAMQDGFHARYDGLPGSVDDAFQREKRADLARRGIDYMPYGMLTLAPILHPRTMSSFEAWSADGKWWRLQPGFANKVIARTRPHMKAGDPYTYPPCAGRADYFDFMLQENLDAHYTERTDAIYFDHGAITRMCTRSPALAAAPGRESWEYKNVRSFYKRLYESVKTATPDTLIAIHTHGAPRALGAFVDFHIVGEALNEVFGGGYPSSDYFSKPSHYTPDYVALPDGYLDAQLFPPVGGVSSVIPQVKWAIDPANPGRARRFQRGLAAILLSNDLASPLWNTDAATVDGIYKAVDRFGDIGAAVVHPWWSNRALIHRPVGLRATAWVRGGKALLVFANLGRTPYSSVVRVELAALGVPRARSVRDLERPELSGVALQGNAFSVNVQPGDLRVVLLE